MNKGRPQNEGDKHKGCKDHNNEPLSLSGKFFAAASRFIKENKSPLKVAALSSVLLGTTSLMTPLISTTIGAGALLVSSLYLLTKSSDVLIDSASDVRKKLKVSPLLAGLTLGAMASLPELGVAISSVVNGATDLGIGQVVGANVAHSFLILGATAAIAGISKVKGLSMKFNTAVMTASTFAFGGLLATGSLTPVTGVAMAGAAALYTAGVIWAGKRDAASLKKEFDVEEIFHNHSHGDDEHCHHHDKPPALSALWGVTSMAGLVYAAHLVVDSASTTASGLGVSDALISSLVIGLGVSLPEFMISVKSALKKDTDMAVGNVLGCNIFNILFVGSALGLAGTAVPESFSLDTTSGKFNLAALGASAAMAAGLLANKGGIKKWQGYGALGLYAAYIATSLSLGTAEPNKAVEFKDTPSVAEIKKGFDKKLTP
jgi:cation:H+ antiporter